MRLTFCASFAAVVGGPIAGLLVVSVIAVIVIIIVTIMWRYTKKPISDGGTLFEKSNSIDPFALMSQSNPVQADRPMSFLDNLSEDLDETMESSAKNV